MKNRFWRFAATLAVGGSAFQLSGCDPEVRGVLLDGLEATTGSLTDALISAFFISIDDSAGSPTDPLTTT